MRFIKGLKVALILYRDSQKKKRKIEKYEYAGDLFLKN